MIFYTNSIFINEKNEIFNNEFNTFYNCFFKKKLNFKRFTVKFENNEQKPFIVDYLDGSSIEKFKRLIEFANSHEQKYSVKGFINIAADATVDDDNMNVIFNIYEVYFK